MAVLGLRCCTQAFSSCCEWGLLFVAVCRLLLAVASAVATPGSRDTGCMWGLPRPGLEPMFPAL